MGFYLPNYMNGQLSFTNINIIKSFDHFFRSGVDSRVSFRKAFFSSFLRPPIYINSISINNSRFGTIQVYIQFPFPVLISNCHFLRCVTTQRDDSSPGALFVISESISCSIEMTTFVLCHSHSGPGACYISSNLVNCHHICAFNCSTSSILNNPASFFKGGYSTEVSFYTTMYSSAPDNKAFTNSNTFNGRYVTLSFINACCNSLQSHGSVCEVKSILRVFCFSMTCINCSSEDMGLIYFSSDTISVFDNILIINSRSGFIFEIIEGSSLIITSCYSYHNKLKGIAHIHVRGHLSMSYCYFDFESGEIARRNIKTNHCLFNFSGKYSPNFQYIGDQCQYDVDLLLTEDSLNSKDKDGQTLWIITSIIMVALMILGFIGGFSYWDSKGKQNELEKYTDPYPISDFINLDFAIQ